MTYLWSIGEDRAIPIVLSTKQLVKNVRVTEAWFTLIAREAHEEEPTKWSKDVGWLLVEYVDMTPEELLIGLPLDRGIDHHIDLIPGSSLPNQAAYRLSPTKNAELNQQVQKLLEKEFIREILSSCMTSSLLAPKKDGSWWLCMDSRAMNRITIK